MVNSKKNEKEMTINLDTLGVPIAIIVSGILIATMIFFASRNNNNVDNGAGNDTTNVTDEGTDTPVDSEVTLGDDPYLGNAETAKVAVIDFSDYQCGYCQRHSTEVYPSIKENYIDTGKILYVFKEFPLSGAGQIGYVTAEGASCVFNLSDSETYAKYHKDGFFLNSKSEVVSLATSLGINEGEFNACLDEGKYQDEIEADQTEGQGAGISGTPGFVVGLIGENGVIQNATLIAGAYPYDTFVNAIEKLLE